MKPFDPMSHKLHQALINYFVQGIPVDGALFLFDAVPDTDEDVASFLWTAEVYASYPRSPIRDRVTSYMRYVKRVIEEASSAGLVDRQRRAHRNPTHVNRHELPITVEDMRDPERQAFYKGAADKIDQAAARVIARGDGFGGRGAITKKAFIVDVAKEAGIPVRRLAPMLVAWRQLGWIVVSRADLRAAMDPKKVADSEIDDGVGTFHFIEPLETQPRHNPAAAPSAEAVDLYKTFHRYDPKRVGALPFEIPRRVHLLGEATAVLYRSSKVDPSTLRKPRRPQNYIHEHEGGVRAYNLDKGADTDVPDWILDVDSLVLLGDCLGFGYRDDDQVEVEVQGEAPLPELYSIPSGRALLVVEGKREVAALIWGGALDVEGRGIVG